MPTRSLFARAWQLTLTGAIAAALSACSADGPEPSPDRALRARFPLHAAEVLEQGEAWVPTEQGFAPAASRARIGAFRGFAAELPRQAQDPIRLRMPDGREVRLRELGAQGQGEPTDRAIAYRRPGGASFWTAAPDGIEHWVHLDAGLARRGEAVAAWKVEGAALEPHGEAVALMDEAGAALLWVTAPRAFAGPGRAVHARLSARGAELSLWVDGAADGEALLVDPSWTAAPPLSAARSFHTATLLEDGKVLITGGQSNAPGPGDVASTELYDPATNSWTAGGSMASVRAWHSATRLADGKVLVAGSYADDGSVKNAELYDPTTNTWAQVGSMANNRAVFFATLLDDGRVLVAGGESYSPAAGTHTLASAELYDPKANTWSSAGAMSVGRNNHGGALLDNGKVLIVGGSVSSGTSPKLTSSAELYDPKANTWSSAGAMSVGRTGPTVTRLGDGRVLVAGGFDGTGKASASVDLYDPKTNTWTAGPPMIGRRYDHTMTLLQSGKVLVTGGIYFDYLISAELYDPKTNTWAATLPMGLPRSSATATLLGSGKVLVAGGFNETNGPIPNVELFDPAPSDIGVACASGADCASGFCADGVCCDTACDAGACDACSIAAGASKNGTCAPVACSPASAASSTSSSGSGGSGGGPSDELVEFDGCGCGLRGAPEAGGFWLGLGLLLWARRRPRAEGRPARGCVSVDP